MSDASEEVNLFNNWFDAVTLGVQSDRPEIVKMAIKMMHETEISDQSITANVRVYMEALMEGLIGQMERARDAESNPPESEMDNLLEEIANRSCDLAAALNKIESDIDNLRGV